MTQRPKAVWGTGIATHDLNRLSYQIEALQKEKTDLAILYSDATRMYDLTNMNLIYETYDALMCLGKKVKFVTELKPEKMYNYDILFVPGVAYAKEATLDSVVNYINNGGNVVLLGDDCFKYTEYMHDADAEKRQFILDHSTVYSGIKSSGKGLLDITNNEYKTLLRKYLKSRNKIWVEVLDASTGELCEDIEYNLAVYNGKLLVNICNYGKDTDINVYMGNKKAAKSLEMRSMKEYGELVRVEQYKPVLLEIDTSGSFMDIYGHWAEAKINEAYTKNLVRGVSSSRFEPDKKVTRAEFLTMLVRASEMRPELYREVCSDVYKDKWYAAYIQPAYDEGIIDGELVRPDDYITREEMCEMTVREYEQKRTAETVKLNFTDTALIEDAVTVSKAYGSGIISGYDDNSFRPKSGLTRAEAVTVILNLYDRTE